MVKYNDIHSIAFRDIAFLDLQWGLYCNVVLLYFEISNNTQGGNLTNNCFAKQLWLSLEIIKLEYSNVFLIVIVFLKLVVYRKIAHPKYYLENYVYVTLSKYANSYSQCLLC